MVNKKRKGNYTKYSITLEEIPYYVILKKNEFGEVEQIMEKPRGSFSHHVSGAHLIMNNPRENHYDHASGGLIWKEYPEKEGKEFKSRYFLSGGSCFINTVSGAVLLD